LGRNWQNRSNKNSLNPVWAKKIILDYNFETRQKLKLEIYDSDSSSHMLEKHDFLGLCEASLGTILSARSKQYRVNLKNSREKLLNGIICIAAEEQSSSKKFATLEINGIKLDKKDFFGKSDPFLCIYRKSLNDDWILSHRTEVIKGTLNPKWQTFTVSMNSLCNGDYQRPLKFEVNDWNLSGSHKVIGSFITNMASIKMASDKKSEIKCINEEKKMKKGYSHSGSLIIIRCDIAIRPSFIDYIQGGTVLNFSVAIDFTASNGDPRDYRSLHYIGSQTMENQYTVAIRSVGEIIQDYDTDKQFPGLGFG